jgi:hypothetical protein
VEVLLKLCPRWGGQWTVTVGGKAFVEASSKVGRPVKRKALGNIEVSMDLTHNVV